LLKGVIKIAIQKTLFQQNPNALINYYEKFTRHVGKYIMYDTIHGAFEKDIIQPTNNMKLIGRLIYRYFHSANPINNYRIAKSLSPDVRRLMIVSTVFMVYRVW